MIESGNPTPLADIFPDLISGLPGEVEYDYEDGDTATATWVNQCLENNPSLGPSLQFESLLSSLSPSGFSVDSNLLDKGVVTAPKRPSQPATPISPRARSPESSDSSYHRSTNPVPRHKRPSHKRAETKRRDKIKLRLDDVKVLIPSIAGKGRLSESTILSKAAEYQKRLMGDCERFTTEAADLRREIESLSSEIHSFQDDLPASGLKAETSAEEQHHSLDQQYRNYVTTRTKENWKFYLFRFFMKPLFQSFKTEVATDDPNSFLASVTNWTNESLGLSNLRHHTLEQMRDITRETNIMNHPESLPDQAMASVTQISTAAESACTSPFALPCDSQSKKRLEFTPPKPVAQHQRMQKSASHKSSAMGLSPKTRGLKLQPNSHRNLQSKVMRPVHDQMAISSGKTKNFAPLLLKLEPPISNVSVSSTRSFIPMSVASPQQSISSMASDMADITRLATSIGETTLSIARPSAVMSDPTFPISSQPSGSSVARLITGSQCHEYDFDITDIPDLPDAVPSPQPLVSISAPFSSVGLTTFIEAFTLGSSPVTTNTLMSSQPMRFMNSLLAQPAASAASIIAPGTPATASWL